MSDSPASLRLALAQLNPTVGSVDANAALAAEWIARAAERGADLVLLPELTLTGYPPEDLLLKPHFLDAVDAAAEQLAAEVSGITALVGLPFRDPGGTSLHNGLAVIRDGQILARYAKVLLPNYGVFDERRYFEPGAGGALIAVGEIEVGLTICEDIWFPGEPAAAEAAAGASLIVNASASPYHRGKGRDRELMVAERARENGVAMALCNMVGGQDELVFDGHSVIIDAAGQTLVRAPQFEPELIVADLELPGGPRRGHSRPGPGAPDSAGRPVPTLCSTPRHTGPPGEPAPRRLAPALEDAAEVYSALRLGLADYAGKNGFTHTVLGLSGGIDSALVALLAADALGPENLSCVVMPSPHSSEETQADARQITTNLDCELIEIAIEPIMAAFEMALAARFEGTAEGVAEENLQSRIRGTIVMALSNKFGWLPLATGNKSEMSVGYATLYGDMAGGFAVIKDLPKTLVYELVEWRNDRTAGEPIPAAVIDRPPSAELRPDQLDTDSLPPYELLDPALEHYVERDGGLAGLVAAGIDDAVAARVIGMVDRAEYKRRQAPVGVKITPKAFGRDRRVPITNRFGG